MILKISRVQLSFPSRRQSGKKGDAPGFHAFLASIYEEEKKNPPRKSLSGGSMKVPAASISTSASGFSFEKDRPVRQIVDAHEDGPED